MVKTVRICFEWFAYVITGVNTFEFVALRSMGHIQRYFPELNSDLVTISTIVGIFILLLNGWMKYDNHKTNKREKMQMIKALEIKNHQEENGYYAFKTAIDGMPKEEFKNSADRLK